MSKTIRDLTTIACFVIFSTLLIWLPHILALPIFWGLNFSNGFNTIYRNFDGLEYIVIAKTWYDPSLISQLPQNLPASYFAAHFPGYSILIAIFAPFLGYLKSMLFVSLLSTILATWAFYLLVRDFKLSNHPLFLSIVFLVLPARWLIVRSVGSAEPLFILFTIMTLYFFMKFENTQRISFIFFSSLFGFLAQITRPPGILLLIALSLYILWKIFKSQVQSKIQSFYRAIISYYPLLLIPGGLLLIFVWFGNVYQDIFAYFHSGDNIHLTFLPFQSLNKNQFWVGDIWLEDIIYIFILGFLGGLLLLKQKLLPLAFFVLTYLIASIFVAHRDISRYTLPAMPFVLIAFEKILTAKEFKIVLMILALAIYLYAQNFLIENSAPVANLAVFN